MLKRTYAHKAHIYIHLNIDTDIGAKSTLGKPACMCLFMATGHYRVFSLWTTWKTGMGHHSLGTRSLQNCLFLETRICQRMIMMVKWLGWSQSLLTRSGTWRHCRSRLHFSTTLIGLIVTKVSPLVLCRRGNTSKIRWMWSCFAKSGSIRLPCRKSRL